ncbi:MAG: hypothetical protein PHU47_01125 [Candidatus ainarchaeum sp.]|nr:hypothetical protein [Candidatus ainarchaeum sp.]
MSDLKNKKSLSPLIATILLIVVSVILISVILTWGSSFAKNNTEKANTFLESSKQIPKSGVFWLDSLIGDKVILKNNLSSSVEIKGYKILKTDFNSDYFWLNSYRSLENNLIFNASSLNSIPLVCVPESKFFLELIDVNDQPYSIEINPRGNSSYTKCNAFNVPLWEFEEVSGSYTINTFTKEQGDLITNGGFDIDTAWIKETNWSVFDGTANANNANGSAIRQNNILMVNKKYLVIFEVKNYVSGFVRFYTGTGADGTSRNSNGLYYQTVYAATTNLQFIGASFTGSIDNVSVTEVDPLETITDGTKYLEIISYTGTSLISSENKQVYGVWEFDFYYTDIFGYILFINDDLNNGLSNTTGYTLVYNCTGNNDFTLRRYVSGSVSAGLFTSSQNVLSKNTWYRFKIIRYLNNTFDIYLMGGQYGDNWIKINSTAITDSSPIITSNAFSIYNPRAGDRIANLKITPEIE